MNPALWLLLRMRLQGWARRRLRTLRTPRGLLYALFLLGLVAVFLGAPLEGGDAMQDAWGLPSAAEADQARRLAPLLLMLGFAALAILGGRGPIGFDIPEVHLVLPGPFGRRELLAYRLLCDLSAILLSSFWLSLVARSYAAGWLQAWVGTFLLAAFAHVFGFAVTVSGIAIGARADSAQKPFRLLAAALLFAAVMTTLGWDTFSLSRAELVVRSEQSQLLQVCLTPFHWFRDVFIASRLFPDLAGVAALATTPSLVLVGLLFRLNVNFIEHAAVYSETADAARRAPKRRQRLGLRMARSRSDVRATIPWWGGVGPVAWRQFKTLTHTWRAVVLPMALAGWFLVVEGRTALGPETFGPRAMVAAASAAIIIALLASAIRFDFRDDIEHLEVLKQLPLPSMRLVVGQIVVPVGLLTLVQVISLGVLYATNDGIGPIHGLAITFGVLLNVLVVELENLFFLWFPSRAVRLVATDGRRMLWNALVLVFKLAIIGTASALAFELGRNVRDLTGDIRLAVAVSWGFLAGIAAALLIPIRNAFQRMENVGSESGPAELPRQVVEDLRRRRVGTLVRLFFLIAPLALFAMGTPIVSPLGVLVIAWAALCSRSMLRQRDHGDPAGAPRNGRFRRLVKAAGVMIAVTWACATLVLNLFLFGFRQSWEPEVDDLPLATLPVPAAAVATTPALWLGDTRVVLPLKVGEFEFHSISNATADRDRASLSARWQDSQGRRLGARAYRTTVQSHAARRLPWRDFSGWLWGADGPLWGTVARSSEPFPAGSISRLDPRFSLRWLANLSVRTAGRFQRTEGLPGVLLQQGGGGRESCTIEWRSPTAENGVFLSGLGSDLCSFRNPAVVALLSSLRDGVACNACVPTSAEDALSRDVFRYWASLTEGGEEPCDSLFRRLSESGREETAGSLTVLGEQASVLGRAFSATKECYCRYFDPAPPAGRTAFGAQIAAISVGENHEPVAAVHKGGQLQVLRCHDVLCSGDEVQKSTLAASGTMSSRIAIGADGLPIVAYYDSTVRKLRVAHCDEIACAGGNATVSAIDEEFGWEPPLALTIGRDGLPVLVYAAPLSRSLKVTHCDDVACAGGNESTSVVAGSVGTGSRVAVAVGSDGLPLVGYYDSAKRDLKLIHCNDVACAGGDETTVVVDEGDENGQDPSIAIGADGLPIVSYYDATNGDLKVVHCGDVACGDSGRSVVVIDASGDVGRGSSIAIGGDGFPVMVYHDTGLGDVKVAHCNDLSCSGADESVVTFDEGRNAACTSRGETSWNFTTGWFAGGVTSIAIGGDGLPLLTYTSGGSSVLARCDNADCAPRSRREGHAGEEPRWRRIPL